VGWRFAVAFALLLCIGVAAFETSTIHSRHQRLDAMRVEQQRIETELQQVKAIAEDPRPVVVLENDNTRVIVPIASRGSAHTTQQPIIY
jgi:predicted membrane metal-binding protein